MIKILFFTLIFAVLILHSIIKNYHENKHAKQMILGIPNPETGSIKWISKYQKTWLDKLMEWLPQSLITGIATFTLTLMLFFDVVIDINLSMIIGIITGIGLLVIGKVLAEMVKRKENKKNNHNSNGKVELESEVNHNEMSILSERNKVII